MNIQPTSSDKQPFPFMAGSFTPGTSQQFIDGISDTELRALAVLERHYYRGEGEQCVALAAPLLKSTCYPVRISAALMFTFGSLCSGDSPNALMQMEAIRHEYEEKILQGLPRSQEERGYAIFMSNLATVLLHISDYPFVEMDVRMFPGGIRMIALYVLAHSHYLKSEYGQAAGIAETALSLSEKSYPIGEIYLHLIASIAYMNLKEENKAEKHFLAAWEIAKPEGFIEPFAEHHGLLYGLVEVHLRQTEPESYEKIIRQVYMFAEAWRNIHNTETGHPVAGNLTAVEFTIAMLASRGWSNASIAGHIGIAVSTVKTHIYVIYQKLGIKSRKELHRYMLK